MTITLENNQNKKILADKESAIRTITAEIEAINNLRDSVALENLTAALDLMQNATGVLLNRFLPGGRGLQNKEFLLSLDEINQMLDIAEEVLEKSGVSGHIGTELPLCIVKNPDKYKHINVSYKCAAAKEFFVIEGTETLMIKIRDNYLVLEK